MIQHHNVNNSFIGIVIIKIMFKIKKNLIISDSRASLLAVVVNALSSNYSAFVFKFVQFFVLCSFFLVLCSFLTNISVFFLCIPGQVVITGIEFADQLASLINNTTFFGPPYCPYGLAFPLFTLPPTS